MGEIKRVKNFKYDAETGERIYNNQKFTLQTATDLFEELLERVINDDKVLSIQLLLMDKQFKNKVKYDRLWNLCKKYSRCKKINEEIKSVIRERLIVGALKGDLKENFAKFLLTGLYGMQPESKEITVNENVKFEFGNPELNSNSIKNNILKEHIIDVAFEEENDDEE